MSESYGKRLKRLEQQGYRFPTYREGGDLRTYPVKVVGGRWMPVCDHRHVNDGAGPLDCAERHAKEQGG